MSGLTREERLLATFVSLADTLIADYDVVDLLQTLVDSCIELLDTDAAGILLANSSGELEVIVSSSEAARLVETMQLSAESGPCIESFESSRIISTADISQAPERWSQFRDSALDLGFSSVLAIPMRLRETTIGTLNLLREDVGELPQQDAVAARAFADVATIGILQERSLRESSELTDQLQTALNRRVVIEQAKGVVAHTHGIPIDEAFSLIRRYARSRQLPVSQVAARLVDMTLDLRGDPAAD